MRHKKNYWFLSLNFSCVHLCSRSSVQQCRDKQNAAKSFRACWILFVCTIRFIILLCSTMKELSRSDSSLDLLRFHRIIHMDRVKLTASRQGTNDQYRQCWSLGWNYSSAAIKLYTLFLWHVWNNSDRFIRLWASRLFQLTMLSCVCLWLMN